MWLLLLAILLHFHFFFDCSLFNLHARALRYVFVMRVYSLFKFMRNGQKSVYSAVMIWLCSWNILLSIHHFKSRSLLLVFFFILITGIRYHNSINWITLAYDSTKRNSTKELTWVFFVRPFVNRIPCDTVFIVVWALVFQFVKTLETIKNVTMDEWMKRVRIWWAVIVKHLNIKPNNNCQIQKNRQWNVYS